MVNKLVGEVEIELNNQAMVMRPDFRALAEIESKLDRSLISVINDFDQKGIKLSEMLIIMGAGLKSAGNSLPPGRLEIEIEKQGITKIISKIIEFLKTGLKL